MRIKGRGAAAAAAAAEADGDGFRRRIVFARMLLGSQKPTSCICSRAGNFRESRDTGAASERKRSRESKGEGEIGRKILFYRARVRFLLRLRWFARARARKLQQEARRRKAARKLAAAKRAQVGAAAAA